MALRLWLIFVFVALPALALAKPKVAVAPFDGDDEGTVADAIAEAAAEHAKVTGPKPTSKALDTLGLSDARSTRAQKKLRGKLGVDAVIHGKVEREDGKRHVTVTVSPRGGKASTFELTFKTASNKKFREELRDELGKRLASSEGEAAEADEDDKPREEKPKPKPKKKKKKKRKHDADEGDGESESESEAAPDDEDEGPPRHRVTQAAIWLDGGAAGLHRTLTYDTAGAAAPPPPVGTGSFSGAFEAEAYPLAMDSVKPPAAGLGIAAAVEKTVGLSIKVPGTNASAPINEAHYEISARYRFVFGQHSVAAGIGYWSRRFTADRSSLMGANLDMPDVKYAGIAPLAVGRFGVAPKVGIAVAVEFPLMLASGPITDAMHFGQGSIVAGAIEAAADIAFAEHYGLRIAALFDQVSLQFKTPSRGVTGATDRSMGVIATFAVMY